MFLMLFLAGLPNLTMSTTAASLFPLSSVRLLKSDFTVAADANRQYMLALDADRLLAPFRREAGLKPRKPSYGNWEGIGLDGHTAGHYLSALADMVASGHDTGGGELRKRLDYMVDELDACQKASGDGYIGGVPDSKAFWKQVSKGHIEAFNTKWVPWYNLHKTFAGLRDAYLVAHNEKARNALIGLGDWAIRTTSKLTDDQMQAMLGYEHGGMAEVLVDLFSITHEAKYLTLSHRFFHHAILGPLERREDRLTGLHANTQIPKIIGYERFATLTRNSQVDSAARFFWDTVTTSRTVAFGGNSVSEHFNNPKDFEPMLEHREGPETCNTYNMLRLTESLFASKPEAKYVDYYEKALYNHILASIDPSHPGFVYFTPIRPGHYRVYSQPEKCFWCCVGTGMENPGRYGQFIYAREKGGVFVNLFIPSELTDTSLGMKLRQETTFPDEEKTRLLVHLTTPRQFAIHLRHPAWVEAKKYVIKINGRIFMADSTPSSYVSIDRLWKDGDRIEVELPMQISVEGLPDGSSWHAILKGPILLAAPSGIQDQVGLFAGDGRGDHIPQGPLVPLDQMPAILAKPADLPEHVSRDSVAGPMHFRLTGIETPKRDGGIPLQPFYRLQESRYQMYFDFTSKEQMAARRARLAEEERLKLERDAATLDRVAVGEQQPEVDHQMTGEGLETGFFSGRRWRHGKIIQYVLDSHGVKQIDLAVTYSGGDSGRAFDILVNGVLISKQELKAEKPGQFFEIRYPIPMDAISVSTDGRLTIRFVATQVLAGGLYDVRLLRRSR